MRVLLLGAGGTLGAELQRSLATVGEVVAPLRSDVAGFVPRHAPASLQRDAAASRRDSAVAPPRGDAALCGDVLHAAGLRDTVQRVRPDVIVNAAAYTAVDAAEDACAQAFALNAEAPQTLALAAQAHDAALVHFSTEHVFAGTGSHAWTEDDAPAPLNTYGRSKREGELRIAATGARAFVFRTSWLYGRQPQRGFAWGVLQQARAGQRVAVVDDQVGAPTSAALLADWVAQALAAIVQRAVAPGVYHLANAGAASRWEWAVRLLQGVEAVGEVLATPAGQVQRLASASVRTRAARPANSRLATAQFEAAFGFKPEPWQVGVDQFAAAVAQPARQTVAAHPQVQS